MKHNAERIKAQYGDPFRVAEVLERAAASGYEALSEDDLFMCQWLGLYTHRHERDYFMLRTRQPNGFITPEQLETIADIAERNNRGFADITTRQDIQLHWIHYAEATPILRRLASVGISTKGACGDIARNVVGCPVAGVDREELFDTGPIAQQVSDFFLGNFAYANLPRKYKIGVSACRTWCVHPEIQCVALVGVERRAGGAVERGFDLRVGGGLSTQPFLSQRVNVFVKPEDAVQVVRHITELWRDAPEFRLKRHHARIKYLIHDWGVEKFRAALEQRVGRPLPESPDVPEPADTYRDHVGVHVQRHPSTPLGMPSQATVEGRHDGVYYVGVPVLVGRITATQMKRAAELCRRYGDGTSIRLTNRQNLLLLNIPEANVEKVLAGLADVGLSINAHPVRRSVVTCTGTEFCKLAITETKARSRQIVEYLEKRVPLEEPLRLHIAGCPNACAQYQIGHIGLMGSKTTVDGQVVDAYDIFVGGQLGREARFNHPVLRKVPATECAQRLERLLVAYRRQRKNREPFNAWCERVGDPALVELLTGDQDHPLAVADDVLVPPAPDVEGPVYG